MKKSWRYVSNIFDTATKNSFKKMLLLITDCNSKLEALRSDPDIDTLYLRLTPVYTEYSNAYSNWTAAKGNWQGETIRFYETLEQLVEVKVIQWEAQVRADYLEDTADYKKIFPNGRSTFREGPYDIRISSINAMSTALKNYPSLAATKTDIDHFYTDILGKRNVQTHCEELVKEASDILEQKRVASADMLFGNLGILMDKHRSNPTLIEKYFDLSLLRSSKNGNGSTPPPEPLTGKVAAKGTVTLLEGGFDANSYFSLANNGGTSLMFYTAKLPSDPVPGSAIELVPGDESEVFASDLGADTNLFLMVYNPDEINEGEYSFLLIDQSEE